MITVAVPALNEEKYLRQSILNLNRYAKEVGVHPLDIIVVNDGSTDRTAEVIRELEKEFPHVRSITHETNQGLGTSFMGCARIAKHDRIALFPGDDAVSGFTMRNLFRNARRADFVGAFIVNTESRTWFRYALSTTFSMIYVFSFGIHLKYIHDTPVYSVPRILALDLRSRRYSLFAEINVKLMRSGCTFLEVEGYMNTHNRKSSAVRFGNLFEVMRRYLALLLEVYVLNRGKYSGAALRVPPLDFDGPMAAADSKPAAASISL
jgi:glycosyltransferase involved in cell wall biosynthesis